MSAKVEDDIPFHLAAEDAVPGVPGGVVREDPDMPGMWEATAPGLPPCYAVTRREAVAALRQEAGVA